LVGLTFEQIRGFHWQPEDQIDFATDELTVALEEAIVERRRIQELAADPSAEAQKEKEWLLRDAEDALARVRLIADLIVGAFFSAEKDRERKQELGRRLQLVTEWLKGRRTRAAGRADRDAAGDPEADSSVPLDDRVSGGVLCGTAGPSGWWAAERGGLDGCICRESSFFRRKHNIESAWR
jgi:hypothetical protein